MMFKHATTVRRAAVAGMFYPGDEATLRQQLTQLLAGSPTDTQGPPKVLIVPHAGYVYSGATAARAYACLKAQRAQIERVVLLGPAHRVYLQGMALPSVDDRNPAPGSDVIVQCQPYDDETGVKSVFAFFKDPDTHDVEIME